MEKVLVSVKEWGWGFQCMRDGDERFKSIVEGRIAESKGTSIVLIPSIWASDLGLYEREYAYTVGFWE